MKYDFDRLCLEYVLRICSLLQLQDTTVLKKEIERWKEEVKVQEGKSALNSGRLKSEVDAHKETREKLDKLLTETRAENEKIRSEYSEFIKKLKEEEKRQKFAEQEQSVKVPILYYVSPCRGEGVGLENGNVCLFFSSPSACRTSGAYKN